MIIRVLTKIEAYRKWWLRSVLIASLLPALILLYKYQTNALGFNPYATLIETTGIWSIAFLLLTLLVTPLRRWLCWFCNFRKYPYGKRLSDWNYLILSRKMLGNYTFFYATIHCVIYLHLDMDWDWQEVLYDIKTRHFLTLGLIGWLALIPLAATSFKAAQKKLGKYWRKLHRLTYVIAIVGVCHIWLEAKPTDYTPYVYTLAAGILLGHRLAVSAIRKWRRKDDTGMEVYRRPRS